MGLISGVVSKADNILKSGDDAAQTVDDGYRFGDDFVSSDESAQPFIREAPDGMNSGGGYVSFDADSYPKRVFADFTGRTAEQPARIADATTSGFSTGAKWLGGGTVAATGLWAGSEVYEDYAKIRQAETQEAAFSEYQAQVEQIRNDPNLSPEEKAEMLAQLREAYERAVDNPANPSMGTFSRVFDNLFGGMGTMDKVLVGVVFVILAKLVQEVR